MKDKYEGCYIDGYKDHYAVFADNGEKLAEYDTHKEAKEDIAEWEAEVKNESYIPADTLATGYRFTIHETELLENAIKKHVEQKVDQGVNAMFDTDSEEFKKVGNEPYDKSQWWDDMKLTMRIKKTPYPRKNGYTNGDFRPNQKWLMGAIECCKSARDCDYLLKDAYLSVAHDKKLIQNLKSVRDGNPNKYVNVKVVQKWLDNGVTPEKVEKHIEWFKANYIKGLQAKKKEFNKIQNETVIEEPMNEGLFGLGKKKNKEIPEVPIDEIKIIQTNFRKAYDNWWFYLSFKDNNIDKEMLCAISNHIRKICNSEHGFDAYPTEFMVCSPKDIVREYKVDDYFDKEYLKNKNNIIIFSYEFVGRSNIKSVAVLKQQLGARYFTDVVNNAVYYQIKDDPKNKGIPIPDIINNSKNYAVSYIDKDTLMAMYNYFASRSTKNESVDFYDSDKEPINEGTAGNIALGIFCLIGMAPVIAARAMEAKDKRRLKTGKGAHKISYEEFSTMYNSTKKLIQDVQRLQKSSKYYKIIYKYNEVKEQIVAGNKSSNILDAFKKGIPIELYGICDYFAYDCIEKYKDLLKSLPEPDKDYYSGKNEDYIHDIEYAIQDEFSDHLDKLGFADGKDYKCRSSKYPGIYISYTESGDGTWFHIYPDCPGTVVVIDNNKLNEDHSEISNDPEMEELMALAGVTTADLDDLENDNDLDLDDDDPIDANTLREIDAAMDESVKSAINNIELATKGMDVNIEQIEKFIPVAKDFMKYVKSAPIAYDENTGEGLKIKNDTVDFINKCLKFDYDRGSDDELKVIGRNWIKYNLATLFDKLSFNNKKVSPAQLELYKKCIMGGEFDKRLQKCYNELKAILKELNDFYDQLAKKLGSDFEKTVNYKMLNSFGNEYNYFWRQYCFTTGDKNATMKYAGRTRVSFFGKRVRDSINESVGGVIAISVAGLIGGAAIVNAITERKLKAEAKEMTKAEFDKLINDMITIDEAVISKLKTSKWWKFIYEPCMNRKNTPDIHSQASKYKQEFMSGKCIGPSFHSSFVDIDDPDPKIYTKLDAEIGKSPDDDAWEKAFDSAYYESQKLIKEAVKKLGFNDEGKSSKYPDIKIDIGSGEYIGIWIEPIYNGYYKLKDAKKSQNESVETNLDIILAESAEFLLEE